MVSCQPADEITCRAGSSRAVVECHIHRVAVGHDRFHAGTQPQFAAEVFEAADQRFDDGADPAARSGQAFQKNGAEQYAERAEIQIVLARAAVEHHGAQQHFGQQRIGDDVEARISRALAAALGESSSS